MTATCTTATVYVLIVYHIVAPVYGSWSLTICLPQGVADANEESYMYHICNTPGRVRYDASIRNRPLWFGEWSLSTNFDASDAFMRRWADAQKFVFSQTRGWIVRLLSIATVWHTDARWAAVLEL